MSTEKNAKAYLALMSIYFVWGTTYLAIRIGVEDLPPVLFTGLRWFAAGPILFLILLLQKYKLPDKKDLIHLGISGLFMLGGGNGFVVFAEQWIPSGLTALLITTVPFWIVGLDALLPYGKKMNLKIVTGLILGLCGVILIFGEDFKLLLNPNYLGGVLGLMAAVFLWSAGTLYSKYKKVSVQPLMGASIQMIIAGSVITIFGLVLGETGEFHFTQSSLYAYLYLVFVGSIIGYGSYIYAIAHLPVSLVATYAYVNPIIALFLGWLILGEKISIWIMVAAVVILIGVMIVKKGSDKPADIVKAEPAE